MIWVRHDYFTVVNYSTEMNWAAEDGDGRPVWCFDKGLL